MAQPTAEEVNKIAGVANEAAGWIERNGPKMQEILNTAADRIKELEKRCDKLQKELAALQKKK